ncbi:helix-turn-helix domain-containing protein [Streptomyces sp900116325]|uniref:helix-turn-helix domain-containing protein n=1 Tax=Streptomyces sp. 900116325 TaxID=3154295 RepID=UPI0033D9F03D
MSDPLRRIDALVEEDTLPTPQVRQRLRLAVGLTQTEVAEAIGVKRLAVARWEAGLAQPHRGNRRAYAHLLRRLAVKHPNAAIEEVPDEEWPLGLGRIRVRRLHHRIRGGVGVT